MKKIFSLLMAALFLMAGFTACGQGSKTGSTADYKQVVETARPEGTDNVPIVTSQEEDTTGLLAFMNLKPETMKKYAVSVSLVNIKAYAIAIVLPEDGKQKEVEDSMNAFVEAEKKAFENYLQDQYAIAKSAIVKTTSTGEVVLVMCEDGAAVMSEIEKQLKQ